MSTELKFAGIKDELTSLVDGVIRDVLDDKDNNKNYNKSSPINMSEQRNNRNPQISRGYKK